MTTPEPLDPTRMAIEWIATHLHYDCKDKDTHSEACRKVDEIFEGYDALKAGRVSPLSLPAPLAPRKWPDDVLYTGKEIRPFTGLLAMFQTEHDERAGGECGCKLCKKYGRLNFSLFLPPTEDPEIRAMQDARRAKELGLLAPPPAAIPPIPPALLGLGANLTQIMDLVAADKKAHACFLLSQCVQMLHGEIPFVSREFRDQASKSAPPPAVIPAPQPTGLEAHRPSERCPRWHCYKEAYYLGGKLISCTDNECANYDKEFMRAVNNAV